jgi:DNA-binding GntR family transcriptional regulator
MPVRGGDARGACLETKEQRATIRHLVEEKLRELISLGHFRPGDRLVERELCEMFDVGRTSVREALRQLEAEGLIQTEPHRGPFVSKVTYEEAQQLYTFRALLEGFCGAEFAIHGTDEEHRRLQEACDAFARAAKDKADTAELVARKTEFYRCLIQGARNTFVESVLTSLHNRVTLLRSTTMTQPDRLPKSVQEIREVTAAICARDADAARLASVRHVDESSKVALHILSKR